MNKKRFFILLLFLWVNTPFNLFADSYDDDSFEARSIHPLLEKHFTLVVDPDGRSLRQIRSKNLLLPPGGLKDFVRFLLGWLKDYKNHPEQALKKNLAMHVEDNEITYWAEKMTRGLQRLPEKEWEEWLNESSTTKAAFQWDQQFQGYWQNKMHGTIVANLSGVHFYHRHRLTQQAVTFGRLLLAQIFPLSPFLKSLDFVVAAYVRELTRVREFEQFMLLAFLEQLPEAGGLSLREVALVRSSIYEAQISWFRPWDFWRARKTWSTFGTKKWQKHDRRNERRARSFKYMEKLNFAFYQSKKTSRFYNAHVPPWMFSKKISLAFDPNNPRKLLRMRVWLTLAHIGFQQLPLPSMVTFLGEQVLASTYAHHQRVEGALVGWCQLQAFENPDGDFENLERLIRQQSGHYFVARL